MVGIAAAIGMVSPGGNLALVIEQRVQHVERLARRRCNQLGVEGAIAVGEVGVSLEARFVTVVGIQVGGGTTSPAAWKNWPSDDDAVPLPKCAANGSRCCWLTRQRSARR